MKYIILLVSVICLSFTFYKSKDTTGANAEQKIVNTNSAYGPANTNASANVSTIVTDALAFYNLLSAAQQASLQLSYSSTLARKWSNLPCGTGCRNGVQLGTNLTSAQFAAAMQIVKDALGTSGTNGYEEFHDMNIAEAYLHANGGGSGYDSTLRWMAFLNTPSTTGSWMLQFGGHHYAANISFNNGHVIGATPFFMGLEPKTFTYNSIAYDPLGDEKTAFANALSALSSSELSAALISSAFSDCVMVPGETNGGTSSFPAVAVGQPVSALTTAQQNLVLAVIQEYLDDMDATTAAAVLADYTADLSQTYISYHGSGTSGDASGFMVAQGDYARISGPNVWIEFSCQGGVVIQNQIHYHTIWRDRTHDYGADLAGAAIDGTTVATGISESKYNTTVSIYPNPANETINLVLVSELTNAKAVVTDLTGKVVLSANELTGHKVQLNTESLEKGVYMLRVTDKSGSYSGKFTKQ